MKRISGSKILMVGLLSIVLLSTMVAAGPSPEQPNVTFELVQGLPETMQVGESYTVEIHVTSDVPFTFSAALPGAYYPGRYIVAREGDRSQDGTSATLFVTFTALESTAGLPNSVAPVSVTVGTRFQGGNTVSQRFDFLVEVQ